MTAERVQESYDTLAAAQEMAEWFGDYLLGVSAEPGDMTLLTYSRLYEWFGEGDAAEQLTTLAESFDQFSEDQQMALALYICGYPEHAIETLSDVNLAELLALLGDQLRPYHEVLEKQEYTPTELFGIFSTSQTVKGSWRKRAVCQWEDDPELFFPIGEAGASILQAEEAKLVCSRCPVKNNCLEHALDEGFLGIWGGTTEHERDEIRVKFGLKTLHLVNKGKRVDSEHGLSKLHTQYMDVLSSRADELTESEAMLVTALFETKNQTEAAQRIGISHPLLVSKWRQIKDKLGIHK